MVHLRQTTSVASCASSLPQVGLRGEPGSESRSDLSDVIVSAVFLSFDSFNRTTKRTSVLDTYLPVRHATRNYRQVEPIYVMSGFFAELQRRKVYRVAVAYIIASGFLIQIASAAFPAWELPKIRVIL